MVSHLHQIHISITNQNYLLTVLKELLSSLRVCTKVYAPPSRKKNQSISKTPVFSFVLFLWIKDVKDYKIVEQMSSNALKFLHGRLLK